MNLRNSIWNLVSAAMEAKRNDDCMNGLGYESTPFFSIYGKIVDAIFNIAEESTVSDFEKSFTYGVFHDTGLSQDQMVDLIVQRIESIGI